MEFPKYIVKVIGNNNVGTGIIIDNDLILTAKHLMNQEEYKIELYNGNIINANEYSIDENKIVGLLKLEDSIEDDIKHLLTSDYTPYQDDKWEIYGYITSEQIIHYIKGIGTHYIIDEEKVSDMQVSNISVGQAINYRGMSGSPVIVDGMIIGIVQEQIISSDKATGIKVSSISSFAQYINRKYIESNKIKSDLKKYMSRYTKQQIYKNIESGKYIPKIFVEQNEYKEYLRFFCEPRLFINKSIEEIQSLYFKDLNEFLKKNFNNNISFKFPDRIEDDEKLLLVSKELSENLKNAIKLIENIDQMQNLSKSGDDIYYRETKDYYNRALKFDFGYIARNLEYIKYRYLIITNNAGQGKTNFICDFTKNFLLKKKFFVLYINAYEVNKDLYDFVCDKIMSFLNNKNMNYILNLLEQEYKKTFRPFVILIDGLNENNNFDSFSNIVRQFLEKITNYNFIKVVMTTREEFYDEKFKDIDIGIYSKYFKRVKMFNNNPKFQDRIFWGYLNFFKITIRKYTLFENIFERLSSDTLLLRFFCEANRGNKQIYMYDIYKYNIFQEYLKKKIEEYNKKKFGLGKIYIDVLDKLIEYMIKNNKYYNIPIDMMTRDELEFVYELVLNDVVLKDDIILSEGFLKEKKTVISFTFDEFRDFYIAKYIARKYNDEQIKEFIESLNKESNVNIKEGVFAYLFFIGKIYSENLIEILKTSDNYATIYWNNIFKLADENVNDEDIKKIENEFLNETKNRNKITMDLLFRYDTKFFKKLNIKKLFDMMNLFCEKDWKEYENFIIKSFQLKYLNSYYRYDPKIILPYDIMIEEFNSIIKRKHVKIYKELFKMTIFLHDVSRGKTYEFWKNYLKFLPDMAIETLEDMNNKVTSEINKNIKNITHHILCSNIKLNDEIKNKLQMIYNENNKKIEENVNLENILKYIKEERNDEDH